MPQAHLRSFRLICNAPEVDAVEALLRTEGYRFVNEPFFPLSRRLTVEPRPLGSSLAARFGLIYIQDRSSMLPPLALAPRPGSAVLDMCASPGSKTGLLGQLTGKNGFVLGNEPSRNRLATLRRNLSALDLLQCGTCSFPGERIPMPGGAWDAILLDPPCSGWGTLEKNPQVQRLWQGDRIQPLIRLQQRLLAEAFRLLAPGGRLVYSTCTTNLDENEAQVAHAVDCLGLRFIPIEPPPGFGFVPVQEDRFWGCLRVQTGPEGQGFFVALLEKPGDPGLAGPRRGSTAEASIKGAVPPEHGDDPRKVRSWPEAIPRASLDSPWLDLSALPEGDIADYNGVLHFLPAASREILPPGLAWKGFALGKNTASGPRLNPALRSLLPDRELARRRGLFCLDVDDAASLRSLLSGQSVPARTSQKETALYFQGLPLCRLTVKNGRAIQPRLQG